jgi:hypothetical protein
VRAVVRFLGEAVQSLGGDICRGAEGGAARILVRLADRGADPEIDNLHATWRQHDITGCDVAMDDPTAVNRGEAVGDIGPDRGRLRPRQRPTLEPAGQRVPIEQFHHHERRDRAVGPDRLAVIVHGGDVGMRQPRGGTRLAAHQVEDASAAGKRACEQLERDLPAEQLVAGAPYHRHATRLDAGHEAVAERQPRAGRRPVVGHHRQVDPAAIGLSTYAWWMPTG